MGKRKLRLAVVITAAALFFLVSGGCMPPLLKALTSMPETPTAPGASPSEPIPAGQLAPAEGAYTSTSLPDYVAVVEKVKPSVAAIKTDEGEGSGWVIDSDGIIVTNSHVVDGARTVAVSLDDGRTFPAEEMYTDPLTDLAVVVVDAQGLPAADIGDSEKLRVGEQVAAIGNPLGLGISMKGGWISRLDVSIEAGQGQTLSNLIETDAAINPGNSGGPLVNMAGEVIGITSAKISLVGVEGMGYAISISSAEPIITQLIDNGYVIRPYLGVGLTDVNQTMVWWYDLSTQSGAFISHVAPGSPADGAGLQPQDVIIGFNGMEIGSAEDLIDAIHQSGIGTNAEIVYVRGDSQLTAHAILTESPPPQ